MCSCLCVHRCAHPRACPLVCVFTRVHPCACRPCMLYACVLAGVALKHSHLRSSTVLCLPVVHIFHLFYISPTYYDKIKNLCVTKHFLGYFTNTLGCRPRNPSVAEVGSLGAVGGRGPAQPRWAMSPHCVWGGRASCCGSGCWQHRALYCLPLRLPSDFTDRRRSCDVAGRRSAPDGPWSA